MATPYRRKGSPFYWADVWFGGKKRSISLKTDNYGVARAMLHQRLADLRNGDLQLPTKTPVAAILEKFVSHLRASGRPKSVQTDVYRLREFFGPACPSLILNSRASGNDELIRPGIAGPAAGKKKAKTFAFTVKAHFVEQVTTAMVSDFLNAIRNKRRLDPKTVNEYREILFRFFGWAIAHQGVRLPGDLRGNPVAPITRMRSQDPAIRFLRSIEDIRNQLAALAEYPQIQAVVAVLIYAGLRRSELLHLTSEDVDMAHRRIYVRQKQVLGSTYRTKTGRNRFVPVSGALLPYLLKYQPTAGSRWYFPSPEGTLWDGDNFSHRLADINGKAGLVWNCLDYRHTFGSHMAMKGESLYKIAELMGNSPEICRRHYACLLPESLVGCVEFDVSCPRAVNA